MIRLTMIRFAILVTMTLGLAMAGCGGRDDARNAGDTEATDGRQGQGTNQGEYDRGNTEVDNTSRNERDSSDATLTPMDQGGSEGDRTITQNIRKLVVDNGSLSVNAKNVKIITNNGVVTLRGPVDSSSERDFIANAAKSVAGVTSVDNQLEVKTGS